MKTLYNGWFITGCITWLIVYSARRLGHPIPGINGYIDDLIAIPVISNLGLWFQRQSVIRNNYYVLAPWQVAFIVLYVTIVFEALLPALSKTYTADWVDIILYIFGGLFFYKMMNRPLMKFKKIYH